MAAAAVAAAARRALGTVPGAAARLGIEKSLQSEACFIAYEWIRDPSFYVWLHSDECGVEWDDGEFGVTLRPLSSGHNAVV